MKPNELTPEVLIEILIRKIRMGVIVKMPRLDKEPFMEYTENIREEVEYTATEMIKRQCDKRFGKRRKQWKLNTQNSFQMRRKLQGSSLSLTCTISSLNSWRGRVS